MNGLFSTRRLPEITLLHLACPHLHPGMKVNKSPEADFYFALLTCHGRRHRASVRTAPEGERESERQRMRMSCEGCRRNPDEKKKVLVKGSRCLVKTAHRIREDGLPAGRADPPRRGARLGPGPRPVTADGEAEAWPAGGLTQVMWRRDDGD